MFFSSIIHISAVLYSISFDRYIIITLNYHICVVSYIREKLNIKTVADLQLQVTQLLNDQMLNSSCSEKHFRGIEFSLYFPYWVLKFRKAITSQIRPLVTLKLSLNSYVYLMQLYVYMGELIFWFTLRKYKQVYF